MNPEITWQQTLSASEIAGVDAMLDRVRAADGVSSLSEHTHLLLLAGGGGAAHLLARVDGQIAGYGVVHRGVAEILVDPAARGHGVGGDLLNEVMAPGVRIWSHGDLPAARHLAQRAGLVAVRRLLTLTRRLEDLPTRPLPAGYTLRTFTPQDADAWLELNAAAFTDLPDQGGWTRSDLEQRLNQPWFDADGFLLAVDDAGLAGSHWTKVHDHDGQRVGEVYVLAVAPRAQGTGLGSALTVAGLEHLRDRGLSDVMLYVDSSNTAAMALYSRLGFEQSSCDVQFALAGGNARGDFLGD